MLQENLDEAALAVQKVHADVLSDRMREIYSAVCNATGVTGIEDGTSGEAGTTGNPESDDQGATARKMSQRAMRRLAMKKPATKRTATKRMVMMKRITTKKSIMNN